MMNTEEHLTHSSRTETGLQISGELRRRTFDSARIVQPMTRWLTLTLVASLFVGACGGSGETLGADGRELDRCSLITVEEAEDWLGAPVEAAPSESLNGEPDPVTCFFQGASGSVLLQVRDGAVYFAEPGSPARLPQDVTDLGEDAHMDNDSVRFLQDDWSVSVGQILGVPDAAELLEMARLVSSRLPS
jgi:hypothetical protein